MNLSHTLRMLCADGSNGDQMDPKAIMAGDQLMQLTAAIGDLQAADPADPKKLRRFSITAYNGGAMRFAWSSTPVVVDIAGLNGMDRPSPVLLDHSPALRIGHTSGPRAEGGSIRLDGVVSGAGRAAQEVVAEADNGFPWQASIGVRILKIESVDERTSVTVNGQTFTGPLLVVRAGDYKETSFVALGADSSTSIRMVAALHSHLQHTGQKAKGNTMKKEFIAWLLAAGFTQEQVDDLAKKDEKDPLFKTLKASWEASLNASGGAAALDGLPAHAHASAGGSSAEGSLQAMRKQHADEARRIAGITALCAKHPELLAKAIEDGMTLEATELAVLKAERPRSPGINVGAGRPTNTDSRVLEAAASMALGLPDAEKLYKEPELQAAHTAFRGRIGLQELLLNAAWANGYQGMSFRGDHEGVLRAAFSSADIDGILSNVANKFLLRAYMGVESAWREISAIRNARDFKTMTSYRLTDDLEYIKVGPTGEIKHGELGQESYTNKVNTRARMLTLTREDQINDDLGALQSIPTMLGRGGALSLNKVFWTEFLAAVTSFFTTGRGNYIEGGTTVLSIGGLTQAVTAFHAQTDPKGNPLGLTPAKLVVPTSLSVEADELLNSLEVRPAAATRGGTFNPHKGKYKKVESQYLNNANIPNGSATHFFLLADPMDMPLIETAFLDGREVPTIESAAADFNTLGIQMRGFHDFGVAKQEYRAGVRSKGAA